VAEFQLPKPAEGDTVLRCKCERRIGVGASVVLCPEGTVVVTREGAQLPIKLYLICGVCFDAAGGDASKVPAQLARWVNGGPVPLEGN